jgi:Cu+-exporting ATPase
MSVNPATAKANAQHAGKTYYFCCNGCATRFQAAPEQFIRPNSAGLVTLGMPVRKQASHSPLVGIFSSSKLAGFARDPVCGMSVNPQTEKYKFDHAGNTYSF